MNKFEQLGLKESLQRAIIDLGFENPTEVQEKAIPLLLEQDTDLVALAQTGTGKTAAFGFPLIQKIDADNRNTQALILSPTRELCLQITNEIKNYSKYEKGINVVAVYGGASITEQARDIKRGAQIIVATPGRMQDMINRGLVNIKQIDFCILDEADEMLNMGFYEDIVSILSDTPEGKSTWLFSATMPAEVARIAKKFMENPLEITVGAKNSGSATVSHEFYMVNARDRYEALKRLADANPDIFSVVFCRTKRDTQQVAERLIEDGYNAAALHGDLSQAQRDSVMKSFRGRQIQMLVATDVAARGIDVDNITHVVNYQLPDEIETYNHRSGRTGRAGKLGTSIVIVTKSELRKISSIERIIKQKFEEKTIPSGIEICEIQLLHLANKIKDTEVDHEIDNYLPAINNVLEGLSKEELIKKMVSVEFNRFINYYKKTRDLSAQSAGKREDREPRESNGGAVRYFVNIGSRDDFDWMQLKDFLKETLDLGRDDVYKVDVKEGFSFFNTDPEHTDKVMEILNNVTLGGRRINVEISKNDGGGRRDHNGRSSGGGFGGDRGGRSFGGGDRGGRSFGGDRGGKSFGGGFKSDKPAPRFSSDRAATSESNFSRSETPRREGKFTSEKAPRRSESFSDQSRPKRPRKS
ncbi:MAG: ATP-dependent RNA helicase [Flavobacterium sp. BFFFF1]|uniref:DEAD/DEAH box helicase n=1 Tax=unclassified Flavobacterium TaxID=196869 RepID=UPI000BC8A6E4|nr:MULTISPECIES: DEAD/DEAH box helicase [unclassified Flavobacterium]OYU79309.1 MAG: ATP-dependent RNA helicase [Flavobacterium sp. BFFFF1]